MEDEEAVAQATLNHLKQCADLLTGKYLSKSLHTAQETGKAMEMKFLPA